jgi:ribosomal protein S12 methylthiotransferase
LGCAKNLVDSERLLGLLNSLGLALTENPAEADLLLVNTCAFIEPAVSESIETILELDRQRKPGAKLAVVGCLPARDKGVLAKELPEADLLADRADYPRLPRLLAGLLARKEISAPNSFEAWPRALATPPWRAYLKVAEGCDRRCSFCIIPRLRGPLVAKPLEELVAEAEGLARGGALELTLVAQDLTAWVDRDLGLGDLVEALAGISGLRWLRLMYAHPLGTGEKLIKRLAQIEKVVPYLDLPLQHAAPGVLKRMGRPAGDPLALIKRLRKWWPGVALRTTIMVGFPGESEADFETLKAFVLAAEFEHLGVFQFQPEEPTPAASLPGRIPKATQRKRRAQIMGLQKKIALSHNRARVGQEREVLVEGPSPDSDLVMVGRASFQAPEVDGLFYFDGPQPKSGQMVKAKVLKARAYDLAGRLI